MRKGNKATHDQLKELYQAASEFIQAQSWKVFYDADIICIENPKDRTYRQWRLEEPHWLFCENVI
jgi:hypothetical protein